MSESKRRRVPKMEISGRPVDLVLVRPMGGGGEWTAIKVRRLLTESREGSAVPLLRKIYVGRRGGALSLHRAMRDLREYVESKTGSRDWEFATSTGGIWSLSVNGPLADLLSPQTP